LVNANQLEEEPLLAGHADFEKEKGMKVERVSLTKAQTGLVLQGGSEEIFIACGEIWVP
jgi:hypothetical protein